MPKNGGNMIPPTPVAMSPNLDGHLYTIHENENREEVRCPVLQFIYVNGQVMPLSLHLGEGRLIIGGKRLVRDDD